MSHHTCVALAHFLNTLLTLAVCGFPFASVYDSDSSNHVHRKHFVVLYPVFLLVYRHALTQNVGAILILNEDFNALQNTGTVNHTLSDIMSVYMVI